MADYQMIFVVGSGRSGTTVMSQSLQLHSECTTVPFELQLFTQPNFQNGLYVLLRELAESKTHRISRLEKFLKTKYSPDRIEAFYLPSERNYDVLVNDFLEKIGDEGADVEANRGHIRDFCDELFAPTLERSGARLFVDDSPPNGRIIPELLSIYPDAKFLHMYRDGISVADSYLQRGWNNNFTDAVQKWYVLFDLTRRLGRGVAKDAYMELNLNELGNDAEGKLRSVQKFIGVNNIEDIHKLISPNSAGSRVAKTRAQTDKLDYFRNCFPDLYEEFYG